MESRAQNPPVAVIAFTVLYIIAAGILVALRGNGEFVVYIGVMVVLLGALYVVHRKINISSVLLWCFSIWGLMHMAGGLLECPEGWPTKSGGTRVLYNLWLIPGLLKYDQLTHIFGFGATTWLCWQGVVASMHRAGVIDVRPTLGILTLCAAGGMGFGALNEIVEFVATLTVPETNVGGYENTGWDLVANLVGCLGAAVWIAVAHWRASPQVLSDS